MVETLLSWLLALIVLTTACIPVIALQIEERAARRYRLAVLNGVETDGLVTDLRPAGGGADPQPRVRIDVMVTRKDGMDYPAVIKTAMSPVHMAKFQPGARIKVSYDPENPERVVVIWS